MTLEELIKVVEAYEADLTLVGIVWSSGHPGNDGTINISFRDGRRQAFDVPGLFRERDRLGRKLMEHAVALRKLLA